MTLMSRIFIALALCTAFSQQAVAAQGALRNSAIMLTGRMNGAQEVPSVATNASGVAAFALRPIEGRLYISAYFTGLSGNISGVHIHEGKPGTTGPVLVDLMQYAEGNSVKALIDITTMPEGVVAKILRGETYINVHTPDNPNGEIRGQLAIESDVSFHTVLAGSKELPPVTTSGYGIGNFTLSPDNTTLKLHVIFRNLSSPITGAHLHIGLKGENGNVVSDLMMLVNGSVISGEVNTNTFLQELLDGRVYINIHTQDNPNGEIRGQLDASYGVRFDAMLDAKQEVPAPIATGTGLADIYLSPTLDTLYYDAVFEGLTGPITMAHFHTGAKGRTGAPIVDLTSKIDGNRVSGIVTGDDLTERVLSDLLTGNLYLNAHTSLFPAGEVRGQVYGLAREGYIFEMSGGQEVPSVSATGTGGGYVSIDRATQNAYYGFVVDGLTGPATMAHFHRGMPGTVGNVVFDFMQTFSNNSAFGMWSTTATMPFSSELAEAFARGGIYANVHTDQNLNGELRGAAVNLNSLLDEFVENPSIDSDLLFAADMNGQSEVPPATTTGRGTAAIHLSADGDSLVMVMTVTGLSGPITDAHIHKGRPGESGAAILPLMQYMQGNSLRMTLTDNDIPPMLAELLLTGEAYVNVHTALYPNGELRGQLNLEADMGLTADLSGSQEVPPTTSNAYGHGSFVLGLDERTLMFDAVVQNMSASITGAHLHRGAAGMNGAVVIDLKPYMNGNRFSGTIDIAAELLPGVTLQQFITELKAGNIYMNVHTENNPNGEIRSQVMLQPGVFMNALLDGGQETPPSVTMAHGTASFWMTDVTSGTIHYSIVADGLSGPITGVHIHQGAVGEPGSVVVDLLSGVNGNRASGQFSMFAAPDLMQKLLRGDAYVNIHTAAYPNGEIRGQIFGTQRDGYAFELCGRQMVPEVSTQARGTAVVSLDRTNMAAHVMLTTEGFGLGSVLTSAQFSRGALGANGDLAFNLTPLLNLGGAAGFWTSAGASTPLTDDLATAIRSGNLYLSAGTTLHTAGEIRGQVVKNGICETLTTGVAEGETNYSATVYPLPASDILHIDFQTAAPTEGMLVLRDVLGRTVTTRVFSNTSALSIDISGVAAGSYIVSIERNGAVLFARPVVKQ